MQRLRPSHVPDLAYIIHLSEAGPGGLYGFTSSHAANTFGLAFFILFTLPPGYRALKMAMLAWAALISYSRIYNGVHYPGDILGGMLVGLLTAWGMSKVFRHFLGSYLILIQKMISRSHMRQK